MAVKKIASIARFTGDTADTKPAGEPVGSTYFDRQTGILYVNYDGTNYAVKLTKLAANTGVDIGDVDVLSIAAGDNNIGNVDIVTLPSGNLGQQAMAASVSVVPASNVTDPTYIGDIKFGEALPAGTALLGSVGIDQTTDGTTNKVAANAYVAGAVASASNPVPVKLPGSGLTVLMAETTITTDSTTAVAAVTGLDRYTLATILLTLSAKTMDAATVCDFYIQYSPDAGTTWDDIAHFAQVTSAAIGNGTYVLFLSGAGVGSVAPRATTDGTLAAGSVRDIPWCDRLRIKRISANFAGSDTLTAKVEAYFQ